MCGISALISFGRFDVAPHILSMTNTIRHRGPDDEGYMVMLQNGEGRVVLGGADTPESVFQSSLIHTPKESIENWTKLPCRLAMGHRRLSILDPSPAGHQPMITHRGKHVLVFNGEIYNFLELREELIADGHNFSSETDTEVILAAYRNWGPDCLNRFIGMFAFVLYDIEKEQVFAARDRFGVKPLYYWFSPEGFLAFASEIKQFTGLPGWRAVLNGRRANDFLGRRLLDHTKETLFADVNQLRGGELVYCRLSDIQPQLPVKRWYVLKPEKTDLNFHQSAEHLKSLFYDSIRLHLRADVPAGTGLSGGLDSSSIVCVINELLREKETHVLQNTFSSCSHYEAYDERSFIKEVTQKTQVNAHFTFPPLQELFETSKKILWHQDEPYQSTSIYAEWHVFKMAAENSVKVMLEGHGADELFAGYPVFYKAYLQNLLMTGSWIKMIREFINIRKVHKNNSNLSLINGLRKLATGSDKNTYAFKTEWLNTSQIPDIGDSLTYEKKEKTVKDMSRGQLLYSSVPCQLHFADRDSMAHSVECRVPFLDHRIVEFVLGCPDDYKIQNGITKQILRKAMAGNLPDKVLRRTDKMGYVTPEGVWAKKDAPDDFMKAIRLALEKSGMKLNNDLIIKCASEIIYGNAPYDPALWRIISFGEWMESFSVK